MIGIGLWTLRTDTVGEPKIDGRQLYHEKVAGDTHRDRFQALHYSCEDLEFARHRARQERIWNIKPPRREVCLNLDLRQTGLGGASCGPRPEAKHVFPVKPEKWTIWLKPYKKEANE